MDLGLKDRVAIVTGGNRGIGYAISAGLLNEGAHVVVASLDPARNAQAIETLKAKVERPRDRRADRSQRAGGGRGACSRRPSPNSAGSTSWSTTPPTSRQGSFFADDRGSTGTRRFDNKLRGTVRCIRHAVPPMRERKWGPHRQHLRRAPPGRRSSAPSRHRRQQRGVQNLTVAQANELGKDGILVNAIVPDAVRTERHDKNIRDTMAKPASPRPRC
jgi:3-oxoacyl-[acyl-carrier protein] reductase